MPSEHFGVKLVQTLEGKVKTDCNCSFLTTHFFVLWILLFFWRSCNPSLLISQSLLCSNFATVCYGFLFSYLLDSQQQMLVILLKMCKSRVPSGKNYARGSMQILCIHSHCVFFICTVCTCCWDENVEWHLSEIYSIFYLYLKVDIMKRQANECCDVLYVFRSTYLWLVRGYSLFNYCVVWQWWLLLQNVNYYY